MVLNASLIATIKKLTLDAGKIALERSISGFEIEVKEDGSFVTSADKEISDFIYTSLVKISPSIPVICEERELVDVSAADSFWLIDPIDSTRSFINGKETYTVNIALVVNNKAEYGFVYAPKMGKLYYTDENKNLVIEYNNKQIEPVKRDSNKIIAVVGSTNKSKQAEQYVLENDFDQVVAVPSSIKLCMVAENGADVYPRFAPTMEWDIAAGHALIKSAGGNVHDFQGDELLYNKEGFLNPYFIAKSCGF